MVQPGTLAHNMPAGQDAMARRLRDLERQVREGLAGNDGQAMQIGAGGITVNDGGSITIEDGGSLNVTSGVLNAAGQITTTQGVTAGGAVESGNGTAEMDASGNITGASLNVGSGAVTGGAASLASVSTSGGVSADGQVNSEQPLRSPGSYNYTVATSYQAAWIDGVTFQIGRSASSQVVKTALVPMVQADADKLLNLTPYWGRYVWDDPTVAPRAFLLAKDVQDAGFGPDIAPVTGNPLTLLTTDGQPILDTTGEPCVVPAGEAYTINYSQLVVPLVAAYKFAVTTIQTMQTQIQTMQTQIAALTPPATA